MEDAAKRLLEFVRTEYGDSVRAVIYGTPAEQSFLYAREGVLDRHDRDITDDVLRDLFFEGFDAERIEDLYMVGKLEATSRVFGDVVVFSFVYSDDHSGIFLSLDADTDPPLVSFTRRCRERIEGRAE